MAQVFKPTAIGLILLLYYLLLRTTVIRNSAEISPISNYVILKTLIEARDEALQCGREPLNERPA